MDASAQSGIGRVHFILRGDFARAVPAYERALALNPRAGWSALQLAHCATLLRDFPRAEAAARRALELQQDVLSGRAGMIIVGAHMRLGHIAALQGRAARRARRVRRSELEFVGSVDHALRGADLHRAAAADRRSAPAARRDGARPGRARPRARGARPPHAQRGRGPDEPLLRRLRARPARGERLALDCLERAAAKRPRLTAARAAIEPALESLRDDPRFRALVER